MPTLRTHKSAFSEVREHVARAQNPKNAAGGLSISRGARARTARCPHTSPGGRHKRQAEPRGATRLGINIECSPGRRTPGRPIRDPGLPARDAIMINARLSAGECVRLLCARVCRAGVNGGAMKGLAESGECRRGCWAAAGAEDRDKCWNPMRGCRILGGRVCGCAGTVCFAGKLFDTEYLCGRWSAWAAVSIYTGIWHRGAGLSLSFLRDD